MTDAPHANKAVRYNLDGGRKNGINFSCTDDTPKTLGAAEGRVCLKRVGRGVSPACLGPLRGLAWRGVAWRGVEWRGAPALLLPLLLPLLHGAGRDRVGSGCKGCPAGRVYGVNYNGCSFRAGVVLIVCIKSRRCRGVDFRFLPDTKREGTPAREQREQARGGTNSNFRTCASSTLK